MVTGAENANMPPQDPANRSDSAVSKPTQQATKKAPNPTVTRKQKVKTPKDEIHTSSTGSGQEDNKAFLHKMRQSIMKTPYKPNFDLQEKPAAIQDKFLLLKKMNKLIGVKQSNINEVHYHMGRILFSLKEAGEFKDPKFKQNLEKAIGKSYSKKYCYHLIDFYKTCQMFEALRYSSWKSTYMCQYFKIIKDVLKTETDLEWWRLI